MEKVRIDAEDLSYTVLNQRIRRAVAEGATEITVDHVLGQRFIADGLRGTVILVLEGVPGGDLGMFMNGPTCIVHGNCEHAPGNTMDAGAIIIHGHAGDAVGHSMRGGAIFVRDGIGYRGGIHMKEYLGKRPLLVVGTGARAFLGEYMAGGQIVVLGRDTDFPIQERGIGSGIHGGEIFLRGEVEERFLGVGATMKPVGKNEESSLLAAIEAYTHHFGIDCSDLDPQEFTRIAPTSSRPFASKYTWE